MPWGTVYPWFSAVTVPCPINIGPPFLPRYHEKKSWLSLCYFLGLAFAAVFIQAVVENICIAEGARSSTCFILVRWMCKSTRLKRVCLVLSCFFRASRPPEQADRDMLTFPVLYHSLSCCIFCKYKKKKKRTPFVDICGVLRILIGSPIMAAAGELFGSYEGLASARYC